MSRKKASEKQTVDAVVNGISIDKTALGGIEGKLAVTMPKRLNLREGPSTACKVVEELQDGTLVMVLALPYEIEAPGWVPVHTGERAGWVMRKHIEFIEEPQIGGNPGGNTGEE